MFYKTSVNCVNKNMYVNVYKYYYVNISEDFVIKEIVLC